LRIGPLVTGLTVVAFGTSATELAVSVQAAYAGSGDLAVGNLVGRNIANVLLIFGLAAVVAPLTVSSKLVRFDVPLMIGASLSLLLFDLNGAIQGWEGVVLVGLLGAFNVWSIRQGRVEPELVQDAFAEPAPAVDRAFGKCGLNSSALAAPNRQGYHPRSGFAKQVRLGTTAFLPRIKALDAARSGQPPFPGSSRLASCRGLLGFFF
jgi:Ca2+/Na+ antiporter